MVLKVAANYQESRSAKLTKTLVLTYKKPRGKVKLKSNFSA